MISDRFFIFFSLALFIAGCSGPGQTETPEASPPAQNAVTEEGFCKEHGVLEAVCTKCNPALIPIFEAKGDWCKEHGFPESFCPICHPEKGGRPSVDVTDDGAPPDGVKVLFQGTDIARLVGLKVNKASTRPNRFQSHVTATIVYDATRIAHVNARAPGVVRVLHADVGTLVQKDSPLCVIESADLGTSQSLLEEARARVGLAKANHARVKGLRDEGIIAEKEVFAARQELRAAKAELASAQATLRMVGGTTTDDTSQYILSAPIGGVVTTRNASIGQWVDTSPVLFEIVDTSFMWAELDIPEREAARVIPEQEVTLTVDGLTDLQFTGLLSYLSPAVDPHTRTVKGRASIANPNGVLRSNMFATAAISLTNPTPVVVVPRSAIQRAKSVYLVFVRIADDEFEGRRVQLGSGDEHFQEVIGRLSPGDEVVTDGSFLLKTETLKESIGAGCCAPEGQN